MTCCGWVHYREQGSGSNICGCDRRQRESAQNKAEADRHYFAVVYVGLGETDSITCVLTRVS
jgi:hypothetical protein